MNILKDLTGLIGNTPLYHLERTARRQNLSANIYAKLEFLNPFGSAKDRSMLEILREGEARGFIDKDTAIIEPAGGASAISLAYICAARGYRLILTMPESIGAERRALPEALGAEVQLTPATLGMSGATEQAEKLCRSIKNSFMPMQFQNPANPEAHRKGTGEEIWRDTDGNVDILVAGFGTGGTISGAAEALKAHNPEIIAVGVEPEESAVMSGGEAGPHRIPGIGAGFLPTTLNTNIIDEVFPVSSENAWLCARDLALTEGLVCGASSGAALYAAISIALRDENRSKNIVVILPDHGERYLGMGLFRHRYNTCGN